MKLLEFGVVALLMSSIGDSAVCPVNLKNFCVGVTTSSPSDATKMKNIQWMISARQQVEESFHPNVSVMKEVEIPPTGVFNVNVKTTSRPLRVIEKNYLCKWAYQPLPRKNTAIPSDVYEAVLLEDPTHTHRPKKKNAMVDNKAVECQCSAITVPMATLNFKRCENSEEKWAFSINFNVTIGFACLEKL